MRKFLEEFKKFISKGNVMDMAVGIIIGGAFTSIVSSLVNDIINPILGLFGGMNFDQLAWNITGDVTLYCVYPCKGDEYCYVEASEEGR